jgi:hypothetical protein
MISRTIDFNDLLKTANLVVAILLVFTFWRMGGNEFIDEESIALAILLCIQTHIALRIERRRRDPFVILLAFDMILFYCFRIVTLTIYPYSLAFGRIQFDSGNSNYALIFIFVANTILYTGLYVAGVGKSPSIDSNGWRATSPVRVILLMLAAIIFAYFSTSYWNEDTIPRGLSFLALFLAPGITILMSLSYYLLFRKTLSRKFALSIISLIVADAVIHSLLGSRGAIVVIVQNIIVVSLSVMGCITLRRKYVWLGIALMPAAAALLVGTFVISTYIRSANDTGRTLELGRALELAGDPDSALSAGTELELILPPIADRAGYFDYSADIIAHRDEYASVLNLSTYGKSIIDNILTPGWDVYDQPKISNALRFIYQALGRPSKQWVTADNYQSDQIGIYGEFYGLFAYACLPLMFVVAFAFKRIYLRLTSWNPFFLAMKRGIVLFAFVWTLDSYGVDWNILQVLPLVVAIFIYGPFFSSERVRNMKVDRILGPLPSPNQFFR